MTDRAINFREIVDRVQAQADDGATSVVSVDGDDPIDVCRRLFDRLEERTDPATCDYYVSKNVHRGIERRLVGGDLDPSSEPFLRRRIRTDVSMPDDAVLFADPDAVTLGGTPTGARPVGVGTISSDEDAIE